MTNIAPALRIAVTVTALATTFAAHRALFRESSPEVRRRAGIVLGGIAAVAVVASHVDVEPLTSILPRVFPLGLVGGLALVIATLFLPSIRTAFDRMRDADVRLVVGTRAAFGAMLLGFGGLGILPETFALSAGLGDLLIVRPWALEHPGLVTVMTLPWLIVPLMVAMDLHGLRKVFASQTVTESLGDGSEPPRHVRRALS